MQRGTPQTVLGRMAAAALASEERPGEMTAVRALRLAMARAAEAAVGLRLSVQGVSQEVVHLEALCDRLPEGELLLSLQRNAATVGLVALDAELRAAVLEAQTLGAPSPARAEQRAPTATDAALALPLVDALLADFLALAAGTALAGWTRAAHCGARLEGPRAARLALVEDDYRFIDLNVAFGSEYRLGRLLLALPASPSHAGGEPPWGKASPAWTEALGKATRGAPLALEAILIRSALPVSRLSDLAPGMVLPLDGASLAEVSVEAKGGHVVGRAKLGRLGGLRALRFHEKEVADFPPEQASPAFGGSGEVAASEAPAGLPDLSWTKEEEAKDEPFAMAQPLSFDLPD